MHEQLEEYLDALARDACYRVDAVLKESPHETTERVFFMGTNGAEQGPFIRKRIDPEAGLGAAYQRLWEAQRTGRRFQHLPRLIECYSTGSASVVVMEYVRGETLADLVWRMDASEELARRFFGPICDAVQELHERFDPPMIHRDLKPSNIMINGSEVTVIDLGIAREYDRDALADTHRFGTRSYAPPEQFGYGQTDERSDVYALGMILYYCLTEKTPDAGTARTGFAQPDVPPALQPVLAKATAFDPAARYATVRELHRAFDAACAVPPAVPPQAFQPQADAWQQPVPQQVIPTPLSTQMSMPVPTPAPSSVPATSSTRTAPAKPGFAVPRGVGIAWNVLLLVVWLFFNITSTIMLMDPQSTMPGYALWGRIVMHVGIFGISFAFVGIALMDKRRLIDRFPALGEQSPVVRFLLLIALAILVMFFTAIISAAALQK